MEILIKILNVPSNLFKLYQYNMCPNISNILISNIDMRFILKCSNWKLKTYNIFNNLHDMSQL